MATPVPCQRRPTEACGTRHQTLAMISHRRITKDELAAMKEDQLRKEVLIPLFRAMHYQNVDDNQGSREIGKDITMSEQDAVAGRVNYSVVAKAVNISGRAAGKGSAAEVFFQINQSLGSTFNDPETLATQAVHRVIVVTNGKITSEAREALKAGLKPSGNDTKVRLINGDELWLLISKYLPDRVVYQHLFEVHEVLQDTSEDYKITASVGNAGGVQVAYGPRPDRKKQGPLLAWEARIHLPETPAGNAVRAALEQFVRSGATLTIDKEFIQSFTLPDAVQRVVGDDTVPEKVVVGQSPSPVAHVDVEFEALDGSHATLRNIGLQIKSRGTDEITFNSDASSLWQMEVIANLHTGDTHFRFALRWDEWNVHQQLDAALMAYAMARGGNIQVRRTDNGAVIMSGPQLEFTDIGVTTERIDLARILLAIQDATGTLLSLPGREIKGAEVDLARGILERIRTGAHRHTGGTAQIMLRCSEC